MIRDLRKLAVQLACSAMLLASAGAQTPHLTGTILIDLPRGVLTGNVCLASLPGQARPSFLLNHGLNIQSVRSTSGQPLGYGGYYGAAILGEGMQYTLDESLSGPRTVCLNYTGAFPVYATNDNTFDFKGMIAFIGQTFRATEQSKWYPVFYDTETGVYYPAVTYDLTIRCPACRAIYINGSAPRRASRGVFASQVPRPLFFFAGRFAFTRVDGATYINGSVSPASAEAITAEVQEVARFYGEFLGIPLRDAPVFLTFQSVDRHRPLGKNTLTFAIWPTVAFDGKIRFDSFVKTEHGQPVLDDVFWHTLAHEMAHYYFGTLFSPHGDYSWFYAESTAEYLSLKAVQHVRGQQAFARWVKSSYGKALRNPNLTPLDQVTAHPPPSDTWYYYWPPLLLALEQRIGEERMRRVLAQMVQAPVGTPRDYRFLRQAVLDAGAPASAWDGFEQECVRKPPAQGCLKQLVDSLPETAPQP